MSTPTANGGGRGTAPRQRELVYCHECQDEWFRDENGLVCPSCGSDFVEIMESHSADPTRRPPRIPGAFDDDYDSSDGENGEHNSGRFSTSSFLFQAPGIMISRTSGNPIATVTSTTHPGGTEGEAGQPGGITGPNMVEMLQTIFASIMGDQGIERVRQQVQGEPEAGAGEAAPGAAGGDHAPQDPMTRGNAPPMPPGLAGLFGGPPPAGSRFVYEPHTTPPRGTVPVDDLPSFLQQLFGGGIPHDTPGAGMIHHILGMPGAGPGGDYVWSEGQLDRVISELMEQHQGNAPPPAPPEVLNNLPKIKVDAKRVMEGEDCAVCKEDLVLEEEVAQLPCRHVYHENCIKRWLESRDTCPICRASTTAALRGHQSQSQQASQQQQQQQQTPTQTRRSWTTIFSGPSRHTHTTTTNTNTNVNNNGGNPSSTNPSGSGVTWSWSSSSGGNNTGNPR